MNLQEAIDTIEEFAPENNSCGYAAVNQGKHCLINGRCVVCKIVLESARENLSPIPEVA